MTTETRKRDPQQTRESILEAAEALFVAKGFAATSMTEIAKRASITKSLIHHHFDSKEVLWNEIKKLRIGKWGHVQNRLLSGELDPGDDLMRKSIEAYFEFLKTHPSVVRMGSWMNLEDPRLSQMVDPTILTRAGERLRQEQRDGNIRSDIDVRSILAMFAALSTHWFAARNYFSQSGLGEPGEDESDSRYLEDMLKVFLSGLAAR